MEKTQGLHRMKTPFRFKYCVYSDERAQAPTSGNGWLRQVLRPRTGNKGHAVIRWSFNSYATAQRFADENAALLARSCIKERYYENDKRPIPPNSPR